MYYQRDLYYHKMKVSLCIIYHLVRLLFVYIFFNLLWPKHNILFPLISFIIYSFTRILKVNVCILEHIFIYFTMFLFVSDMYQICIGLFTRF